MRTFPVLARWLWLAYEAWRDNGFKDIDADGSRFRPMPSRSHIEHAEKP